MVHRLRCKCQALIVWLLVWLFVSQDFILTTGVKVDPDNMGEYAYSDVMTEDEESDRESSMMSSMR